jgi:hypothetical protein
LGPRTREDTMEKSIILSGNQTPTVQPEARNDWAIPNPGPQILHTKINISNKICNRYWLLDRDRDSAVSIAAGYRLDFRGIRI